MKRTPTQLIEQAEDWRERNPQMWSAFKSRAVESSRNRTQWSARGIAEALRWDGTFHRAYGAQFKIPNAITPILGRMVCEEEPEAEAWFRRSHSKVDA